MESECPGQRKAVLIVSNEAVVPESEPFLTESDTLAEEAGLQLWVGVVALVGAMLYVWLLSRSWVGKDQIILLTLGEKFARTGVLDPVAKGMSGGGTIPGSLLQLLIGLPLMLWQDYRAPLVLIGVLNILAGIVIYRVASKEFNPTALFIYFTIYWLSPWRIVHAAMLWEPAFLFLPAALHFWSASKLAKEKHIVASITLGAVLLAVPQIHGSFLFLWILTALLLWKKELRIHWLGFLIGALIGGATFTPMIVAFFNSSLPSGLPSDGFIGKGFLFVAPFLKGIIYWLRLPTLDLEIKEIVYLQSGWATNVGQSIAVILFHALQIVETLTIILSLLASWWYIRRFRAKEICFNNLSWVERYGFYAFLSLITCGGLAPVYLQRWHVIIALHAAMIGFAIWASHQSEKLPRFWQYFTAYSLTGILVVMILGYGQPAFRIGALPTDVTITMDVAKLFPITQPANR